MIWLLGHKGLLGTELAAHLSSQELSWIGTGHEVDVTDLASLRRFARQLRSPVDWLVNCAAWTAVEEAEDEPEACHNLNVQGPENLALLANELGAGLVHMSTDYVFHGAGLRGPDDRRQPYREDDAVDPQGVYAVTKALGEQRVRELCPKHLILRTSWLYGAGGPNFVFTMLKLMKANDALRIVADQFSSPTWTRDLAVVLFRLLEFGSHSEPQFGYGTYHVSGEGVASWHEFAQAIWSQSCELGLLEAGHQVTLTPLSSDQYSTKVSRPTWSALSKEKLHRVFGLTMPPWRDSLEAFLRTRTSGDIMKNCDLVP